MDRSGSRCLILASLVLATPSLASDRMSFPQGTWKLNESDSRTPVPKSQILEIIQDDGKSLSFSIREVSRDGTATLLKWSGAYGGEPRPIEGSANTLLAVTHSPNGAILISGQQPGGGKFEEICSVAPGKNRLACNGTQWGREGKQSSYLEIYDREQPTP